MRKRIGNLLRELRNRSVFRALVAYTVAAWMLLQVADVTFDRLPLPDNAMTVLIVLVVTGIPITAILAWGWEFTMRGIVRHEQKDASARKVPFLPFIAISVSVAVGAGGLMYYLSQNFWEPSRRSIAVLPFTNTSAEADAEYFSDGLTEEIQSLIVRLAEFRVVALSTSYHFKDTLMDVASVASRLGAEAVLTGSVRRYQNQVTVTARLFDGASGSELWSNNYNRELSDIYAIQDDIAHQVARSLHVVLPVAADRRLKDLGTRNVDAYDSYLRGIDYLRKPSDETTLSFADEYLREALALDPEFANAHAAMCKRNLASYRLSNDPARFGSAEAACRRALEIDSDSADVHRALGDLYLASGKYENALHEYNEALYDNANLADTYVGIARTDAALQRNKEAEANFRLAIDTDVSYWASFNAMGNFLFDQGRFMEAAEFYQMYVNRADDDATALNNLGAAYYLAGDFRRAATAWDESLEIKPTRSAYSNTGSMYFYLGEFDEAADRYAYAANLAPNDYRMWGNLADAYSYTDDKSSAAEVAYKRAIRLGEEKLAVNADDPLIVSDVAYYHSRVGDRHKAMALNAQATDSAPDDMYVHYNSAQIHAQFGESDAALTALERAVELGYERELLPLDPAFASFREEERFKRLIAKN